MFGWFQTPEGRSRENCSLSVPFQSILIFLSTAPGPILSLASLWWSSEDDITAAQCIVGGEYRHAISEESHGESAVCRWRAAHLIYSFPCSQSVSPTRRSVLHRCPGKRQLELIICSNRESALKFSSIEDIGYYVYL